MTSQLLLNNILICKVTLDKYFGFETYHNTYTQKSKSNNYDSTSEFCIKQFSNLLGVERGSLFVIAAVSGQHCCCVVIVQVFPDVETFSAVDQLGFCMTIYMTDLFVADSSGL